MQTVSIAYDKRHGPFIDEVIKALNLLEIKYDTEVVPCGFDEQDGSNFKFKLELTEKQTDGLFEFISKNKDASEESLRAKWATLAS